MVTSISREEARQIAAEHTKQRIRFVALLEDLDVRPPNIYGGPPLEECWIAYVDRPVTGPRASSIVLVSKETGEVLYSGSAGDEG